MGAVLKSGLEELMIKHPDIIGDVRGIGLFWGIEIIESKNNPRPASKKATQVVMNCEDRGLLLGGGISIGGPASNNIRLCPPLVITREQTQMALNIIDNVLSLMS